MDSPSTTRSAGTIPSPGSSAWNRLNAKTKQHAHKLRQALAGAVELHRSGRWGRPEIEAAGLRDYREVFGHAVTARHFWRIFARVVDRAGSAGDFGNLSLYLPGRLGQRQPVADFEKYARMLPSLASAVQTVKDANNPTDPERLLVWDSAFTEYQRMVDMGSRDGRARRVVISALNASGLALARTREALACSFRRKLQKWILGGGKPSAIGDARLTNPGRAPKYAPTTRDIELLVAHTLAKGDLRRAWREALRDGLLSHGLASAYLGNPSCKSYVPASIARQVLPEAERLRPIHVSSRQAKLNGAYITRDWSDTLPGDEYGADDTTLPLYYWEEDEDGVHVLRGQFLAMVDNRTNRILAFALHSERNYTATTIRGLILRTHDEYGLPRRCFHFENGIWRSAKIIKGVQTSGEIITAAETEIGLREFVGFRHAKPGNARAKPIEGIFGQMQRLLEDQPGYCGRNEQTEKWEKVSRNKLAVERGEHPSRFFLHRDEWSQRLEKICETYNNAPQDMRSKLRGLSPREAWEQLFDYSKPLVRLSQATRYLLANHRAVLKVGRNGITVRVGGRSYVYRNEATAMLIGREINVYFNPEDMTSCFIRDNSRGCEATVIPVAPAIPATTATPEQLEVAMASVEATNRALKTRYHVIASHFPKNAPSPFRQELVDVQTLKDGARIGRAQEAIRAEQTARKGTQRRLARDIHQLGIQGDIAAIPTERLSSGLNLIKEGISEMEAKPRF